MACLKEEFKSRTKINEFNIKEEFYVFGLWLEIFKSEKRIHICVSNKELDKIYQRICSLSKKTCFHCGRGDCFICNRFKFIFKQYMHYIDKPEIILWKIYLKTAEYGFELKHVIWKLVNYIFHSLEIIFRVFSTSVIFSIRLICL